MSDSIQKVPRFRIPPPSYEEIKLLLNACERYGLKDSRLGLRNIGMIKRRHWTNCLKLRILIPWAIGTRISESVALQRKDIDLDRGEITVNKARIYHDPRKDYDKNGHLVTPERLAKMKEKFKTSEEYERELAKIQPIAKGDGWKLRLPKDYSVRTLPIQDERFIEELKKIFADLRFEPNDYIMAVDGQLLHPCVLRGCIKKIAREAGMDPSRIWPHLLRKSYGTTRADLLGEKYASELLGHSPKAGTQTLTRHYQIHTQDEIRREGNKALRSSMSGLFGKKDSSQA